jgi:hypothetical protein
MVLSPVPSDVVEKKGGGKESKVLPILKSIVEQGMVGQWFEVEQIYKEAGITEIPKHVWWMNRVIQGDPVLKNYKVEQGHRKDNKKMTIRLVKIEKKK